MISFPIFVTIVIFMVIPVSHVSIANAISSIPSGIGANNNFRRSDISSDVPTTMTSTYNQGDPFATQSQNLGELGTSTNRIVYTDPVKSGNEPSIAAHPTNPKIVLAFHKSIVDLLDVVLNRTCDIQRIPDGGKTWSAPIPAPTSSWRFWLDLTLSSDGHLLTAQIAIKMYVYMLRTK